MNEYQFFEAEDFLEDKPFRRWVFAPLPEDDSFWQEWLKQHPEKQQTLAQARQLLLDIRGEEMPLFEERINQNVAKLVERVRISEIQQERTIGLRTMRQRWFSVAASVLLLAGILGIAYWKTQEQVPASRYTQLLTQSPVALLEIANTSTAPKTVSLPDGSVIILYQNSRLSYPRQFVPTKREVYLTGEAFFQVAKDPNKPFLVYANEMVTKVLGTSFLIKAYDQDQQVTVTVKTGKVSVFAQSDKEVSKQKSSRELTGMILTPNQQATLLREEMRIMRSLVAQPSLVDAGSVSKKLVFKRTPIAEVFLALEQAYGVDIVFDEALMEKCSLTASLGDESLFKKLEWICAGTESVYEVVDGQIIIISKGCE